MTTMTDERRMKESLWVIAWRWGTAIMVAVATGVGTYAMMWVKLNAPTRGEFNSLVQGVQNLREDLVARAGQERQINDHETRLRALEQENFRRFPNRREP